MAGDFASLAVHAAPLVRAVSDCGTQAATFCRGAFANSDAVSLAARPQCVLAGLTKAKVATAG